MFGHQNFSSNFIFSSQEYEPPRDKTNIVSVRPAKTQISLGGLRPVKTQISLDMADLSLRWAHNHIVGFVCHEAAHIEYAFTS